VSRSRWAYVLFVVAMAEAAVAVVGTVVAGMGWRDAVDTYVVTNTAMGITFPLCGVLIARHRPRNPIGWLFLAFGLAHLTTAATVPIAWYGAVHGWSGPTLRALVTVYQFAWPFGIGMFLTLALQLFPTGRPVSPRWRPLLWLTVLNGLLFAVWLGTSAEPLVLDGHRFTSLLALEQPDWLALANPRGRRRVAGASGGPDRPGRRPGPEPRPPLPRLRGRGGPDQGPTSSHSVPPGVSRSRTPRSASAVRMLSAVAQSPLARASSRLRIMDSISVRSPSDSPVV